MNIPTLKKIKKAAPRNTNEILSMILEANDQACYKEFYHLLREDVNGPSFDKGDIIIIVIKHDKKVTGGILTEMLNTNEKVNKLYIWRHLVHVLRGYGVLISGGKQVGMLEDKSESSDEDETEQSEAA